jgi:hypothetical protein
MAALEGLVWADAIQELEYSEITIEYKLHCTHL